jgi:hypothetical protein
MLIWDGSQKNFTIFEDKGFERFIDGDGGRIAHGRNLVRRSDSLFFAPQSDSEKKKNAIRKSSARNDQIRGLFGPPP